MIWNTTYAVFYGVSLPRDLTTLDGSPVDLTDIDPNDIQNTDPVTVALALRLNDGISK